MSSTNFSIIIISYNVKNKLIKCLKKLHLRSKKWEIIIIDNNSKDKTFNILKKKFNKKIVLKRNFKNIGFSKAVNQGIEISKGKYILLLNPDTIPSTDAIKRLLNYFKKRNDVGIIGGEILKPKTRKRHGTYVSKPTFLTGIFDFTNLRKIFPQNIFHRKFYYKDENIQKPKDVWGLSGGFMLIKRDVIEKIGNMDENFFMYLEDIDFCMRAKEAGFRVVYYTNASIIHDSGSSSPNKYHINIKAWRKSKKYFFKKHLNFIQGNILFLLFTLDEFLIDLKHKFYD